MITRQSLASFARPFVDRFPRLAMLYRNVRDQLDIVQQPVTTPWGFKLAGNLAMARGEFEPIETTIIRTSLKNVDVLVNVGANIGYYCCHALSMGKGVIAFEPMQKNLRYLCANIRANGWSGVEVYPLALSNRVDVLAMYGNNTGASIVKGWAGIPESYVTLVPCSTMDIVIGTRLRGKKVLVVADIAGAEKWMLEGAGAMLLNDPKPIWMVEIASKRHTSSGADINPNLRTVFHLFFKYGYQAFRICPDLQPVTLEQVELASTGILPFDSHNFLFTWRSA